MVTKTKVTKKVITKDFENPTKLQRDFDHVNVIDIDDIDKEAKIYEIASTKDQYLYLLYESMGTKINFELGTQISLDNYYETFGSLYKEHKDDYLEALRIDNTEPEAVKGLYTCKWCKNDEFFIWSAQTRSQDEGTTNFGQCSKCNKRIKIN